MIKHIIVSIFVLLLILCAANQLFADDQEFFSYSETPEVWITLDKSGSMDEGWGGPNTRLYDVKDALYQLINDPEIYLRWGLATFSGNPTYAYQGFNEVVGMDYGDSAHLAEISKWIDHNETNGEITAGGCTPLPGALRGARYRYMDDIDVDTTGARWCRRYFVLLLTDGEPTYGIDTTNYNAGKLSGTMGDCNTYEWMKTQCYWEANSLRRTWVPYGTDSTNCEQEVDIKTYVIGVALESYTLDSIAIYGGTEHYYPANNPDSLNLALKKIIYDIISQVTSYAGAEVTSIQEQFITQQYEAKMYICSFFPSDAPIWEGHLKAVKLIAGTFQIDSIPDSLVYWDAGENLENTPVANRTIYSEKGYSLVTFDAANITKSDLGVASDSTRDSIINTVYSGSPSGTMGYLGDVFHSTPARIHGPNYFYEDDAFCNYRDSINTHREPMIYAGANDGMLHCFNDSTGDEMWAFIPNDQLPNLKNLLTEHRYYEDANAMAADVWFPNPPGTDDFKNKNEWRTVLIFGQRQGGWNYSALDVTDPYNPDFLFNFDTSMADLGETWSDPVIYKIHKDSLKKENDRFFVFLGGGYWADSLYDIYDTLSLPFGNALYALDVVNMCGNTTPAMGTDYWKIPPATDYSTSMVYPFPAQPSVIDTNLDSYHDMLYIGDVGGQLWKVVLNDGNDSSSVVVNDWEADIIFKAPKPNNPSADSLWQPIFFPTTFAWDGRRWWVFFGTGDRARASKDYTVNRFYAIIDSNYTIPLEEADLKRVSDDGPLTEAEILAGTYKGWYIVFTDYNNTDQWLGSWLVRYGEKATSYPTVLMDTLIFTTFQPFDIQDPCISASGIARLYKMYYKTGSYAIAGPSEIIGTGLPQAPRYSFDISGEGLQIITLPGEVFVQATQSLGIRRKLLWWHETR